MLAVLFLSLLITATIPAQQTAKPPDSGVAAAKKTLPENDVFSGTVTASAADSLTVVRKVPARADEPRTFILDKDTKIEGKVKVNARVTVRFKADSDNAVHALRVIVRAEAKSGAGSGKSERSGTTK